MIDLEVEAQKRVPCMFSFVKSHTLTSSLAQWREALRGGARMKEGRIRAWSRGGEVGRLVTWLGVQLGVGSECICVVR